MAATAPLGARLMPVDVEDPRRWVAPVAPFLVALAILGAAFAVMRPDTTGDEPHYLLAAQSLAFDGDLDVTNDYASRERTLRVVNQFPLEQFRNVGDLD